MLKTPHASALASIATLALLSACSGGSSATTEEADPTPSASATSWSASSAAPADASSEEPAFAEQPGSSIRRAAEQAMTEAGSVRVVGAARDGESPIRLDLAMSLAGDCTGEVVLDGARMEIRRTGDRSWVRADEAFWRATMGDENGGLIVAAVGDRWVVPPAASADAFAYFCDLEGNLDQFLGGLSDAERYEVTGVEEVGGRSAVVVEETAAGEVHSRVYVQADGEHHLLRVDNVLAPGDVDRLRLTDIGEDVRVEAPADGEVVDLSE